VCARVVGLGGVDDGQELAQRIGHACADDGGDDERLALRGLT
jgi:hypothetical protein